jgi:hypothetical protein
MSKHIRYFVLDSKDENIGPLEPAGQEFMNDMTHKVGDIIKKDGLPDAKILKIDEADFAKQNNCDVFIVLKQL